MKGDLQMKISDEVVLSDVYLHGLERSLSNVIMCALRNLRGVVIETNLQTFCHGVYCELDHSHEKEHLSVQARMGRGDKNDLILWFEDRFLTGTKDV